uniref:lysozyme n=1 Tax=Hirondellea gigas TaxID=1518452 RepID=A0A6A7G3K1_9CRUS
MRSPLLLPLLLTLVPSGVRGKVFDKCELARLLETKHAMTRKEVKDWVCIAEYESTFNSAAINKFNWDGSRDYGLFQLSDKYWCDSKTGKNVCRMPCSDLLDDELTDDLQCIKRIIKDTERWKGKGTGLTAWVAYNNRCANRDLNEYIAECYDGSHPLPSTTTTESQPIDNFIPRVPDISSSSTASVTPETDGAVIPLGKPDSDPTDNEIEGSISKPGVVSTSDSEDDNPFVPSARVPYPSHHRLMVPQNSFGGRRGSTAVQVSSSNLEHLARGVPLAGVPPLTIGSPVSLFRSGPSFAVPRVVAGPRVAAMPSA